MNKVDSEALPNQKKNSLNSRVELHQRYALTLEEYQRRYDHLVSVGRHLDGKLTTLFAASTIFMSLTTAAGISISDILSYSVWQSYALVMALVAFILMIYVTLSAWVPSGYEAPGASSENWEEMAKQYLLDTTDATYKLVLGNPFRAVKSIQIRNERKAQYIQYSAILFAVQVVAIVIVALTL